MTLAEMLDDYCRRCPEPTTVGQLERLIKRNHIFIDEGCFLIFAVVYDEIRILCPYAPRGKTTRAIGRKLEAAARQAGFKRLTIMTDRPKAFGRLYPDLKPRKVLFGKELN